MYACIPPAFTMSSVITAALVPSCPLLPHTLDPLRVLLVSLPGTHVYPLPARTSRRPRGVAGWRSQRRLSRGSQWTVTGPLLDFHCPLICPYDWISHPSLGHCDHYAANYEGALYSQVFFSASRGRSGFVFQRCSPDDTTLSESGYASMTL
jgi:hypothetical protein